MLDYEQIVQYYGEKSYVQIVHEQVEHRRRSTMVSEKVKELEQENILLKEQVQMLEQRCGGGIEFPKNCEYCQNFIQHYIRNGNQFVPTYDGHCAAGQRLRRKKWFFQVCGG